MKNTFKVALKPGEKIFVNGAVIRVDRKTSLEFMNDVQFLLQNHVLQPEDALTPLKQLYFIVQIILMTPQEADEARALFRTTLPVLLDTIEDAEISATLKDVDRMVSEGSPFEALRAIRGLFKREKEILEGSNPTRSRSKEVAEWPCP